MKIPQSPSRRAWLAWSLVLAPAVAAQEGGDRTPVPPSEAAVADEDARALLEQILSDFDEATAAYEAASDAAEDSAGRRAARKLRPDNAEYARRCADLARDFPGSGAGFEAIEWVLEHQRGSSPVLADALDTAVAHYVDHPGILAVVVKLGQTVSVKSEGQLRKILEGQADRRIAGHAHLALAENLKVQTDVAKEVAAGNQAVGASADRRHGEGFRAHVMGRGAEALERECIAEYQLVMSEFGDIAAKGAGKPGETLSKRADSALFQMLYLQIGSVAADIEAEDIFGETFKLSDYRGQVVVLDFWGHW